MSNEPTCMDCGLPGRHRRHVDCIAALRHKLDEVSVLIDGHGMTDGAHHKQWVLDQAMRVILTPPQYDAWVRDRSSRGEDWDPGIAP